MTLEYQIGNDAPVPVHRSVEIKVAQMGTSPSDGLLYILTPFARGKGGKVRTISCIVYNLNTPIERWEKAKSSPSRDNDQESRLYPGDTFSLRDGTIVSAS